MNYLESYELCGIFDVRAARKEKTNLTFTPLPIYRKDNDYYIASNNGIGGTNFKQISYIDAFFDAGVFIPLDSNINRNSDDNFLYMYSVDNKVFIGEAEEMMEVLIENLAHFKNNKCHCLEYLKFTRQYERLKNFYKSLLENCNGKERDNIIKHINKIDSLKEKALKMPLSLDKPKMSIYMIDLVNLQNGIIERYVAPNFLISLKQKSPELFID